MKETGDADDLRENFEAQADKTARLYANSFLPTIIVFIVLFVAAFYMFRTSEPSQTFFWQILVFIFLCAPAAVYLFFGATSKTWNPGRYYEQFYERELSRYYQRIEHKNKLSRGTASNIKKGAQKVFIVHGHDEANLQKTARFVERLGFEAVILKEQASGGKTIIEKLEDYTGAVDFVVVLMTPDDFGGSVKNPADVKPRMRQNVLYELGRMQERYGREKVCVMKKGEPENPSDLNGTITVDLDDAEAWKMHLAKEMRHAGLEIDLDKAI